MICFKLCDIIDLGWVKQWEVYFLVPLLFQDDFFFKQQKPKKLLTFDSLIGNLGMQRNGTFLLVKGIL